MILTAVPVILLALSRQSVVLSARKKGRGVHSSMDENGSGRVRVQPADPLFPLEKTPPVGLRAAPSLYVRGTPSQ